MFTELTLQERVLYAYSRECSRHLRRSGVLLPNASHSDVSLSETCISKTEGGRHVLLATFKIDDTGQIRVTLPHNVLTVDERRSALYKLHDLL